MDSLQLNQPLKKSENPLKVKPVEYPSSLFKGDLTLDDEITIETRKGSVDGHLDPEKQSKTVLLTLLHQGKPILSEGCNLSMSKNGPPAEHPKGPVSASLAIMESCLDWDNFTIKFTLPKSIQFPVADMEMDPKLFDFIKTHLIKPVEEAIQKYTQDQ